MQILIFTVVGWVVLIFVYLNWLVGADKSVGYKVRRGLWAPVIGPPICVFVFVVFTGAILWYIPREAVKFFRRKVV